MFEMELTEISHAAEKANGSVLLIMQIFTHCSQTIHVSPGGPSAEENFTSFGKKK